MARNRVIYQSQALYIAPNSTGIQVSGTPGVTADYTTGDLASGTSLLYKLDRVQTCNFNFTINRTDINELGQLARIDSIVTESPTVGLDFSYYLTDGLNERLLGFNVTGCVADLQKINNSNAISGLITDTQGNNYYVITVDEGEDVVGSELASTTNSVIGIGNGFISEYGINLAVGEIPTASVTVEGFNIKCDVNQKATLANGKTVLTGTSPAINITGNPVQRLTGYNRGYAINTGINTTGQSSITALRPGDIVLTFPTNDGFADINSATNKAHIQSFAFTVPLTRTVLGRLGSTFGMTRAINFPLNVDVTVNGIVNELQNGDIFELLCGNDKKTFVVTLNQCADTGGTNTPKMVYTVKGALLTSENYSQDIGGNQTVDLTYSLQIGGANDTGNGIFMSGSFNTGDLITSGILNTYYKLGTGKNY